MLFNVPLHVCPAPAHSLRLECFFVLARTRPWSPRRLSLAAGETGGHINSCPARWRDINQSPLHPHNHLTLPSTYLPTYLPLPLPILTTSQPLLPHLPHPLCPFHITVANNSLRSLHITYRKKTDYFSQWYVFTNDLPFHRRSGRIEMRISSSRKHWTHRADDLRFPVFSLFLFFCVSTPLGPLRDHHR